MQETKIALVFFLIIMITDYPGLAIGFESTFCLARSPELLSFTIDDPNIIPRTCTKRYASIIKVSTDTIILHLLQNRLVLEPLLLPPPAPLPLLFPAGTSIPALGGRRRLPPPPPFAVIWFFVDVLPPTRFLFRQRLPCSSFGGRLACREFIVA